MVRQIPRLQPAIRQPSRIAVGTIIETSSDGTPSVALALVWILHPFNLCSVHLFFLHYIPEVRLEPHGQQSLG